MWGRRYVWRGPRKFYRCVTGKRLGSGSRGVPRRADLKVHLRTVWRMSFSHSTRCRLPNKKRLTIIDEIRLRSLQIRFVASRGSCVTAESRDGAKILFQVGPISGKLLYRLCKNKIPVLQKNQTL